MYNYPHHSQVNRQIHTYSCENRIEEQVQISLGNNLSLPWDEFQWVLLSLLNIIINDWSFGFFKIKYHLLQESFM